MCFDIMARMIKTETWSPVGAINQCNLLKAREETYSILDSVAFFTDQLSGVQEAKERVWIQTMALEPGHFTDLLVWKLFCAYQRGVDVRLVFDAYSDYVTANSFNHLPFLLAKVDREFKELILRRRALLVQSLKGELPVTQTNIPLGILGHTPLPGFMGRDHKKITIIDDNAYIGGVNQTPLDATRLDFMLKTDSPSLVSALSEVFNRSFGDTPIEDSYICCDENNEVLIDCGRRGDSLILETACNLVELEEACVTLFSPYLPTGILRRTFNRAVERGVHVEVITSDETQLGFASKLSQLAHETGQVKPLFDIIRYPGTVHAKALLVGSHSAIIGSHNFDEIFVRLGTEEIALLTKQPEILVQLGEMRTMMQDAATHSIRS